MSKIEINDPRSQQEVRDQAIKDIAVTREQEAEMAQFLSNFPKQEEKQGVFQFLNKVVDERNSSKVANLDEKEELPAVRNLQNGALFFRSTGMDVLADYLFMQSEIIMSTSDSKKGFLINAAITQKKDVKVGAAKEKKKQSFLSKGEGESND